MTDSTPVKDLIANVLAYQYNPSEIQRAVLKTLSDALDGSMDIVDPTNPFVFCLESAAVLTAASMIKNETNNRRQYPYAAQTSEDLYIHMSDKDFVDRFATPAKTKFSLMLPFDETLEKMVLDPDTGMRKLTIPRNSVFTVADINFSLQYPVEVRQLLHGGLQVVYDVSKPSPLQDLESNLIEHEIRMSPDGQWIFFEVDVQQFDIISQTGSLNAAQDFTMAVTLDDQYYYTRVYVENTQGGWDEIRTTHTDQVYDITTPTAVLKVLDKNVTVTIPQIYTSTKLLNKGIRVDFYQTKGPINLVPTDYPFTAYGAQWIAYDTSENDVFTAPIKTFRAIVIFCQNAVAGGGNALTFDELRNRVITNAIGAPSLPITPTQIQATLERDGYTVVKNIDNITNRQFQATKAMPTPSDPQLITAAAASIETISISMDQAVLVSTVIDNGASITLMPETLYQTVDSVTSIVPTERVNYINSLPVDKRALVVTEGNFLKSPFQYVLDASGDEFAVRPYYLDNPTIETKLFVAENDTTLIQVNTGSYMIERVPTGYQITIVTQSGDEFKALQDSDVYVQLAYVPAGEKDRAYLNGKLLGTNDEGERIYTFDLSTNFNVDANDNLQLSKFFLYTTENRLTGAALKTEFEVLYATSSLMDAQWQPNTVDTVLGRFLLPPRVAGIAQEKLRVRFGYSLETLWARSRSVISSVGYKRYDADVPALYEKDVYQADANGSTISIVDGQIAQTLLHKAGDPVLDASGQPTYRFRKGDVMLDNKGFPIVESERGMIRQIDIMLIEGAYWFATDPTAKKYRLELTNTVVSWLTNDLASIEAQLLERTNVFFYPKTTLGTIRVMVQDGLIKTINAGQAFRVDLYVSSNVYANQALRAQLTKTTIQVINNALTDTTISVDAIQTALRAQYGGDVMAVQLTGLGGEDNLPALTILDESDRCSIRKRLVAQSDDSLIVEEDVVVNFIRHELTA
jgi:hypothetical protein